MRTPPLPRVLGQSAALLGVAKAVFLVAGYATTILLTHLVTAADFGRYYVLSRLIAVPNMLLVQTLMFAVSRPIAAQWDRGIPGYAAIRRRGQRMAALLGGATTLALLVLAGPIAAALSDPSLTGPIRMLAPIPLIYGLYAVNVGSLNATRGFARQAALDMFMATAKAGCIVGAAAAGLGLAAIVGGFTLASLASLALSTVLVVAAGRAASAAPGAAPSIGRFAGALMVFTAVVNALQAVDVLVVKHFAVGAEAEAAVGHYSTAQQVALVPYSLMMAVNLLVFPLVATFHAARDRERVGRYVRDTTRVTLVLLAFMSAVASAAAPVIQALLFPRAYGAAAADLRLLVWGFSGISVAVIAAWILNSSERERLALVLVAGPLLLLGGLAILWVPTAGPRGAALAVAVTGAVATASALWAIRAVFATGAGIGFVLRLAVAIAAVELTARAWPASEGKLAALVELGVLAIVFAGAAVLLRLVDPALVRELRRRG